MTELGYCGTEHTLRCHFVWDFRRRKCFCFNLKHGLRGLEEVRIAKRARTVNAHIYAAIFCVLMAAPGDSQNREVPSHSEFCTAQTRDQFSPPLIMSSAWMMALSISNIEVMEVLRYEFYGDNL